MLDRILGKKKPEPSPEHAVLVLFAYGSTDLSRLFALEDRLAVIAHIRHTETPYDTLLAREWDRQEARADVDGQVRAILDGWQGGQ